MQLQVNVEELRKKPFMVATPAYGGQLSVPYHISMIDLVNKCGGLGIPVRHCLIENESLITRARNNIIKIFMETPDLEYMIFIDADIKFCADDVITLLAFCTPENPIVLGNYPKKGLKWDLIESAVKHGVPSNELYNFGDNPVVNFIPNESGVHKFNLAEPIPVHDGGTGFMFIHKSVITKMIAAYPTMFYHADYAIGHPAFDNAADKRVFAFFDTAIVRDRIAKVMNPEDETCRRYLSEDYYFCHLWQDIDPSHKVLLIPWISLGHWGSYLYRGNMVAVLNLRQQEYIEQQNGDVPQSPKSAPPAALMDIAKSFEKIIEKQ